MANGTSIIKKRLGQFIEPFTGGGQTQSSVGQTGGQTPAPNQTPMPAGDLTAPFKQNPFGGVGQAQTPAPTQTLMDSPTPDVGSGQVGGNVQPTTGGQAQVADIEQTLGEPEVPLTTTGGKNLGLNADGSVSALDGQGDGRTKDFQDDQAGGQGIDTDTEEFRRLQNEAFQSIIDSQKGIIDAQQSSADRFETRKQQSIQATEATKKIIQSDFEEAEREAKTLGERSKTALLESRRGFATNTAVLGQLEETNAKRVRDLGRERDRKLALNDIAGAEKLDNLIFQEEEAITNARVEFTNNAFKTLGAVQDVLGFETPQEQRQAGLETFAKQQVIGLESDIKKEQRLKELGLGGYAEATSELKSVANVGLVSVNPDGTYRVVVPEGVGGAVAENILKIRSSVRQEPQFKDFIGIINGYQNVTVGVDLNNAQGDLAIVNGMAKMLDPTGVVRPAEFNTVEEAQGFFERMLNFKEKIASGARLKESVRTKFQDAADAIIQTKASPIRDNLVSTFTPVATGMNVGLNQAVPEIAQLEQILRDSSKSLGNIRASVIQMGYDYDAMRDDGLTDEEIKQEIGI